MHYAKPYDRITVEEGKMGGRPCIRGIRMTVQTVLGYLSTYPNRGDFFAQFPDLEEEDIQQALAFATLWFP